MAVQGNLRDVPQYERCQRMQDAPASAPARAAQRLLYSLPPPPPQRPSLPPAGAMLSEAATASDAGGKHQAAPQPAATEAPAAQAARDGASGADPSSQPADKWNTWDPTDTLQYASLVTEGCPTAAAWLMGAKRRRRTGLR